MAFEDCDFCGWATKNDLKCQDGRVICRDAFRVQNGAKVPLVWNHEHNSPDKVLGHAFLENRPEGVYAYGYFNGSTKGQDAKEAVMHGDVTAMSIWADNLDQRGSDVYHGVIREVSLVLAGANPGAYIESVLAHGEPMEDYDDEGIFYTNEGIILSHAASSNESEEPEKKEDAEVADKEKEVKNESEETVGEVYETLSDKQKRAVAVIVGMAIQDAKGEGGKEEEKKEEEKEMKHNVFSDHQDDGGQFLSHSDMEKIFKDAKRLGSLREAVNQNITDGVLMHSIDKTGMTTATGTQTYGFNDPSMLFPDYKALQAQPEWLSRNMDWVQKVLGAVHHTPFSRIKSVYADITEDDARAKGYIKGKEKKEEVFTTLKRTTSPTTIYKKQKLDRDDIIDIVDFDVVAWIRAEMRVMLNEEIARAILIGDGRLTSSDDHIDESSIRPIAKDVPLFNTTIKVSVAWDATSEDVANATINALIRGRKHYKGSGTPTFFTTEDTVTEMLLLEDKIGNKKYKTEQELATAIRVKEAVTVEPMEGQNIKIDSTNYPLIGIVVNLADYNVGADRGGEISMFDDFDIDYNQQKYLIETRISGALIKPYSALTFVLDRAAKPTSGGNS